jgi:hypothetical protein
MVKKMTKMALWFTENGDELTLSFDEDGNYDKIAKGAENWDSEMIEGFEQFAEIPNWNEFDVKWEEEE